MILQKPFSYTSLALVSLLAMATSGCLSRKAETTGSLASSYSATSPESLRQISESWGKKFEANPGDANAALHYASTLRQLDLKAQAVAVLQQAVIRSPKNTDLLSAYGKALSDVNRLKEAAEVLSRAHSPERPDWRVLSAQGAVADQMGDPATAQRFYESALKIMPNEPGVMSNLGLSYALSKRLPEAEKILRQAANQPRADARVRQNLAMVLGLQGKFGEAEQVLKRDLSAEETALALKSMKGMVSQSNPWNALKAEKKG